MKTKKLTINNRKLKTIFVPLRRFYEDVENK